MPNHWTYKAPRASDFLAQGDLIARTEPVLAILKDIHAYFRDPKYLCFIVLTQSCDLVIHGKGCKARQIALGVVRALDEVLEDIFGEMCGAGQARVYRKNARSDAQELLERLINQNEQAHGLFYLHPDADVGIAVPAVAMLRVSISLRSREHYQVLQAARRGSLDTEYRNKLGWLAGNLYSRVDTTDWADQAGGKSASKKLIDELLDGSGAERNVWVPDMLLETARAKSINVAALPRGEILAALEKVAPPIPQKVALERVRTRLDQVLGVLSENQANQLIDLVKADLVCPLLAAQIALQAVLHVFGAAGASAVAVLNTAPADPRWTDSLASQVTQVVEQFKTLKGPRTVTAFLDLARQTNLFAAPAVECAWEITQGQVVGPAEEQKDALIRRLREAKMSAAVVEHLRSLIHQADVHSLSEKLSGRLLNDVAFNGALLRP